MTADIPAKQDGHDARLNVLFVVPDLRSGGAERQVIDLANGMDSGAFNKSLVIFENRRDQSHRLDRTNLKFTALSRRYKLDFSAAWAIAKIIDRDAIDVVHCSLQMAVFMGSLAVFRCRRKPKLVAGIHTTINRSARHELFDRFLYRYLLRRFDRLFFVCQAQKDHWIRKYRELSPLARVVYNGIDASEFSRARFADAGRQLRKNLGIADSATVIACIAGFRPEKGHALLVQAFAALTGDDKHLILAGDGETRPQVAELARRLDVSGRVHFLGNIDDVRPLLATVNLTVLASTAVETFSFAMLESMSMEVPVLASDIGGLSEAIIEGQTGGLVPPGDPAKLAGKMQEILASGRLTEMGSAGRKLVLEKFSREKMLAAMQSEIAGLSKETAR